MAKATFTTFKIESGTGISYTHCLGWDHVNYQEFKIMTTSRKCTVLIYVGKDRADKLCPIDLTASHMADMIYELKPISVSFDLIKWNRSLPLQEFLRNCITMNLK